MEGYMKKKQSDYLVFRENSSLETFPDQEAIDIYQLFRRKNDHTVLIGKGKGCAVCLMLASRFMPDELHLYPTFGTTIQEVLNEVSARVSFLYFICAPIKVYVDKDISAVDLKKIKRLLLRISSFQKEIVFTENTIPNGNMSFPVN